MARSIAAAVRQIKADLARYLTPADIHAACRAAEYDWRERVLGPVATIHALLLQVLHATAMTNVSRLAGTAFSASAYCQALARLPVELLRTLLARTVARERRASEDVARWRGHRVFLVDGSSCSMPDTPALQRQFEQPTGQKPGCGFPVAHLLTLFDAYTGMLVDVLASTWRTHDLTRIRELHPLLQAGDVLVADRAFCSFAHLALLRRQELHAVLRVAGSRHVHFGRTRRKATMSGAGKRAAQPAAERRHGVTDGPWPVRLGRNDQLAEWRKTKAPSRILSPEEDAALPELLLVRELRYRVPRRGYRTRSVTLVTTLLDAAAYPAAALAELYQSRWQAEVNLRDLKDTLGLRVLRGRSVAAVERELLAFALVYNLICQVRTTAAAALGVRPARVSLLDVLRLLRHGELDATATLVVNPQRPGRNEPRAVKRRPLGYSRMTQPRAVLKRALRQKREALT